jgi:hypothetical protein
VILYSACQSPWRPLLLAESWTSALRATLAPGLDTRGLFFWYSDPGGGQYRVSLLRGSVIGHNPLPPSLRASQQVSRTTCGTFSGCAILITVGIDIPAFGGSRSKQNLLERACSHRLVSARCWPVKPKSSLGGFSLGRPTAERRYRRLGPATLHGQVLMSEHLNETGCALFRSRRVLALNWGPTKTCE